MDHRINLFAENELVKDLVGDHQSIQKEAKLKVQELAEDRMYHGFWDCLSSFGQNDLQGRLAEPRKGATMNRVGNEIYIFGGLGSRMQNGMHVFDLSTR